MHGSIIHLDGTKRRTHVMEIKGDIATTSFGTFRLIDGKWRWVGDPRFELQIRGFPLTPNQPTINS